MLRVYTVLEHPVNLLYGVSLNQVWPLWCLLYKIQLQTIGFTISLLFILSDISNLAESSTVYLQFFTSNYTGSTDKTTGSMGPQFTEVFVVVWVGAAVVSLNSALLGGKM